jgi:hypothetical protein
MPRIKNPALVYKKVYREYVVNVEGTPIRATYTYHSDNEQAGGWEFNLAPALKGMTHDERIELTEEFHEVLNSTH